MIAKNLKTAIFLALVSAVVAGCGSTKIYDADKMLILHGDMHNVSKYTTYSSRIEGTLPNGDVIDLDQTDKKQFNAYLEQHGEIQVTTKFVMDGQEVIYESKGIESYSQFTSLVRGFDKARKKFQKFMGNKKATQLDLS